MGLLSQLEEQGESALREQLQKPLQEVLLSYHPTCTTCGLAMHRHHFYPRSILTRHGELCLQIPVFRCPTCGAMTSGMALMGEEEGRQQFSKKSAKRPSA